MEEFVEKRESWRSRIGFMFAAVGSAVGLVNIWRFPYVVGENGGAAFIAIYVLFLLIIGYPVLVSEVVLGRTAQRGPSGALGTVAKRGRLLWGTAGKGIVLTGFIVASFYSVVAGWIIGYFVQAVSTGFSQMTSVAVAKEAFETHIASPWWCVGYHLLFMCLAVSLLHRGVRKGIELGNKFLMPILVILLVVIMIRGLTIAGGSAGTEFLFRPDWHLLTPMGVLTALGHAFFTLSLGQGTMITYGSYLSKEDNIPSSCAPIVLFDTVVSLLAGIAVLSVVFAAGESSAEGLGLLFSTLPTVFAELPGGAAMGIAFFFLVILAALTSQTSAMEPSISYLIDERGWKRHHASLAVGAGAFLLGVPSALSFGLLKETHFFEWISFITMDILIPIGGLVAVFYVGWIWSFKRAFDHLYGKEHPSPAAEHLLRSYLSPCIRYLAPLLIIIILIVSIVT